MKNKHLVSLRKVKHVRMGESSLDVLLMLVQMAQKHNLCESLSIHLRPDTIRTCSKAEGALQKIQKTQRTQSPG